MGHAESSPVTNRTSRVVSATARSDRGHAHRSLAYARGIDIETSTIIFTTSDGIELEGDLAVPVDGRPRASVVVAHPHPQYGGNRLHPVVDAIARHSAMNGMASLRFDFRSDYDDGRGERLDVIAAATRLRDEVGHAPLVLAGYSFGAAMALSATSGPDATNPVALALVAPPFAMFGEPPTPGHDGPTLALAPENDQFGPPDAARAVAVTWPDTTVEVIDGADHFLMGRAAEVADRVGDWIDETIVSR